MPVMMHTTLDGWRARRCRLRIRFNAISNMINGSDTAPIGGRTLSVSDYFRLALELKSLGHILTGKMPDDGRPA